MKGSLQQLQIKALALCCSLVVYFSGILGFKGQMQSEVLRGLAETSQLNHFMSKCTTEFESEQFISTS